MTLPTGEITLNDVNLELARASGAEIHMNDADVRTLAGIPTTNTEIAMSDLQGKSAVWQKTWDFSNNIVPGDVVLTYSPELDTDVAIDGYARVRAKDTTVYTAYCDYADTYEHQFTAYSRITFTLVPENVIKNVSGVFRYADYSTRWVSKGSLYSVITVYTKLLGSGTYSSFNNISLTTTGDFSWGPLPIPENVEEVRIHFYKRVLSYSETTPSPPTGTLYVDGRVKSLSITAI